MSNLLEQIDELKKEYEKKLKKINDKIDESSEKIRNKVKPLIDSEIEKHIDRFFYNYTENVDYEEFEDKHNIEKYEIMFKNGAINLQIVCPSSSDYDTDKETFAYLSISSTEIYYHNYTDRVLSFQLKRNNICELSKILKECELAPNSKNIGEMAKVLESFVRQKTKILPVDLELKFILNDGQLIGKN